MRIVNSDQSGWKLIQLTKISPLCFEFLKQMRATNCLFPRQILDVLCSLCVCNGVAVRVNQNLICDTLLPERDLLLQTRLVNDVHR